MVIFSEKVEFCWFLVMGPVTIIDSQLSKIGLSKFAFEDDFELF